MSSPVGRSAGGATTIPITKGQLMDIDWINGGALVIDRKNSAKDVTGTTETDLLNGEIVLPANSLGTQGMARFTLFGDLELDNASGSNLMAFKFKLGATTVITNGISSTSAYGVNTTRGSWRAVIEVMNLGATNAQRAHLSMFVYPHDVTGASANLLVLTGSVAWFGHLNGATNDWTNAPSFRQGSATVAVDTTVDQTAAFTVALGNATSDDCQLLGATMEIV